MSDTFDDFWDAESRSRQEAAVALVPALESTFAFWDYLRDRAISKHPDSEDQISDQWAKTKGQLYGYFTSGALAREKVNRTSMTAAT